MTEKNLITKLNDINGIIADNPIAYIDSIINENFHTYVGFALTLGVLFFAIKITTILAKGNMQESKKELIFTACLFLGVTIVLSTRMSFAAFISRWSLALYQHLSKQMFEVELVTFNANFKHFLDTIAEQAKNGVDFFHINLFKTNVLVAEISFAFNLLIVCYYVVSNLGVFFMALALVSAIFILPLAPSFPRVFHSWLMLLLFSIFYKTILGITFMIINNAGIIRDLTNLFQLGFLLQSAILAFVVICFLIFSITLACYLFSVTALQAFSLFPKPMR